MAATTVLLDDLGTPVHLRRPVTRVVSLVPSLTEAIALTHRDLLVGATDWCTHPGDLGIVRVRGTKNPDCRAVVELAPDLVVANMEENREIDVRRLRDAGVPVWVTRIETVPQSLDSMRRLFLDALRVPVPRWLDEATDEWSVDPEPLGIRVAVPIWRDPWMVVGSSTFTGDLLTRLGLTHVYAGHAERYPAVDVRDLASDAVDVVLLPDEPYVFTSDDGPEALPGVRFALVSGRLLTWYGPSLVGARAQLLADVAAAASTP